MNILLQSLPDAIEINGKGYKINTDFRAWVKLELMIQKGEKNPFKLCKDFFIDKYPSDIQAAMNAIEAFYCCGKVPEKKNDKPEFEDKSMAYSFETDDGVIFADFLKFYSIDLTQAILHWWLFRAMLEGLPKESKFKERIYYRKCRLKDLTPKERKRVLEIRKQIKIECAENLKMNLEERNEKILEYVRARTKSTRGVK